MELIIKRQNRTANSTTGSLYVNGAFQCYVLEDADRGLKQDWTLEMIQMVKQHGKTAIPSGRYEVVMTFSQRFGQMMPLLIGVPGFSGVRIHSGNTSADTEGCPLLGETLAVDFVGNSRKAYRKFFAKFQEAIKNEKVFITIK